MPLKMVPGEEGANLVMVDEGEGQGQAPYRGLTKVVMMPWEKQYMEECVKALQLRSHDEVLEIGYGLGFSAAAIQNEGPARHVIIECEPAVVEEARRWAEGRPGVEIVEGFWQHALPLLGVFSAIMFDDFPLPVPGVKEDQVLQGTGSRWHHFLDLVVSHHMRPGSRVTGYLACDLDLNRSDCTYTRQPCEVHVPDDCPYATPGQQTYFVPLITLVESPRMCGHILSRGRMEDAGLVVATSSCPPLLGSALATGTGSRKRARMLAHLMRGMEEEG